VKVDQKMELNGAVSEKLEESSSSSSSSSSLVASPSYWCLLLLIAVVMVVNLLFSPFPSSSLSLSLPVYSLPLFSFLSKMFVQSDSSDNDSLISPCSLLILPPSLPPSLHSKRHACTITPALAYPFPPSLPPSPRRAGSQAGAK